MSSHEEVVCAKVWLKPGSETRVRDWARHLNEHRDLALETLEAEGVTIESVFYDADADRPYLIYYMRCASTDHAVATAKSATNAIDAFHREFKSDCWLKVDRIELLLDLSRR